MKQLKFLKPGATIGVIASGSPVNPEHLSKGIAQLKQLGYQVKCPLDPTQRYGKLRNEFTSAPAIDRVKALEDLFSDPEVSAIISARGGYGSLEMLPHLDFKKISMHPKIYVGFSDVTPLLLAVWKNSGFSTFQGPTVSVDFAKFGESETSRESVNTLLKTLTDPKFFIKAKCETVRKGKGEGEIVPANLAMLLTLLGTPWDISYAGKILVIEDVGEAPYRLHRALLQLKLAGKLEKLAGMVFGRFSRSADKSGPNIPSIEDVISYSPNDIFNGTSYPILCGLEFGHNGNNMTLATGCRGKIDTDIFEMLESPFS